MSWLNRLEAKFGHHAIPGLIRLVAAFNALCFILATLQPEYVRFLELNPDRVMHGEVWRLFTYIFIPNFGGFLPGWLTEILYLMYLLMLGDGLERAWGSFKLNVFYLLGMIGTTIAAFFLGSNFSGVMLNASLLFAFARFYPDAMILLIVLPVKVKWVAWITAAGILLQFLGGPWELRAAVLVSLSNYLLFFGREIFDEARQRQTVMARRARFERDLRDGTAATLHQCKICGRTEVVAPDLHFRVAADGEEYCVEHLPKPPVAS
jgi:membrane associated rhomboid family serine protease